MRSFKIFLQVISHVADPMIISVQDFDEYLVGKLVPYVTCQYNKTKEVQATIDQLIGDLISAVEKTEMQKVHTLLKPNVAQRSSTQSPAVHINKGELYKCLASAGTPYSASTVKSVCNGIAGANSDFRSDFGGSSRVLSGQDSKNSHQEGPFREDR
ncbi:hypothetical protein QZH41_016411 [Actinostola sp. cb2023]|nr:hypothetical protein QZH41_016411 [Actinostola sp. cb2023]